MPYNWYTLAVLVGPVHARGGRLASNGSRLEEGGLRIDVCSDTYGYSARLDSPVQTSGNQPISPGHIISCSTPALTSHHFCVSEPGFTTHVGKVGISMVNTDIDCSFRVTKLRIRNVLTCSVNFVRYHRHAAFFTLTFNSYTVSHDAANAIEWLNKLTCH
ncbi:hypothetical protein VNO77_18878 [Canavalia gladiata]|uniref:Uncharacterized protein n=1 Tax=Canavalia gladiata TaxID=3824 RepID=A0AAN9LQ19_CANGL